MKPATEYCRKGSGEGMVPLKMKRASALKTGSKVALYGIGASRTVKGTGSGDVNERKVVSIWEGRMPALS